MINTAFEKRLRQDFFKLAILTLITVVIWIALITYKALTKSQVKPDVRKMSLPLTPTLDLDTMEKVRQRETTPEPNWDSLKPAKPEVLVVPEATSSSE